MCVSAAILGVCLCAVCLRGKTTTFFDNMYLTIGKTRFAAPQNKTYNHFLFFERPV